MSILNELEDVISLNKNILKAKKKKMKSLPGWYGLDSPHAGGAGISEDINIDEMTKFYEDRTNRHIELVKKYGELIKESYPEFSDVDFDSHDASKYDEPEYTPYIHITWKYKSKDDGEEYIPPEGMEDEMFNATQHHVLNNKHHPEYWCENKENTINKEDRDKPNKLIDATNMSDGAIVEMVADWCAMSEELGKNTPQEWADDNIGVRWDFNEDQKKLIYELMNSVWEDIDVE